MSTAGRDAASSHSSSQMAGSGKVHVEIIDKLRDICIERGLAIVALKREREALYDELNKALGSRAPEAWDRIKAVRDA